MKRPLFFCSVLFLTGIYSNYFLPQSAAAVLFIAIVFAAILKATISRNTYSSVIAIMLSGSFVFGMLSMTKQDIPKKLDEFSDRTTSLKLRISDKPEVSDGYVVYLCDVISLSSDGNDYLINEKIKLTHQNPTEILSLGDIFSARCKISKPQKAQNRGGFDYNLYLKTKGIFHTGYIADHNINIISKENYIFSDYFKLINIYLCRKIDSVFTEDNALFLKAILLGEKSDMPSSYYASFKKSGLSHVIAVSGMHLSYVVMILFALRKLLKISKRIFSVFALFFVFCFMLLTGMSESVVRAGIMLSCVFFGDIFIRPSDPLTSLGLSAGIITLISPYAAFSSSFLLSFAATLGILILAKPVERQLTPAHLVKSKHFISKLPMYIMSTIAVSLSAQLLTFPFTVFMFGEVSLMTLPSNLFITPLCPLILGLGFLFCVLSAISMPIASVIAKILSVLATSARFIINIFSSPDFGVLQIGDTGFLFIFSFLMILSIIILFMYKKKQLIIFPAAMLIIALGFAITCTIFDSSYAYVSFINVGQGDSTLITLPNDINILIDGGKYSYSDDSDVSTATVNSYLRKKGVKNIDFMIATHAHDDHTGGLLPVLDSFNVGCIIVPQSFGEDETATELLEKAKAFSVPVYTFKAGSQLTFPDDVTLTSLMPDNYWSENTDEINNTSLVLRLDCYETSFLFTGDLQSDAERYMMRLIDENTLDIDVLKVGHHGSNTSTSELFLAKTTPQFAFIPVGKNSYGHPSNEVLQRLKDSNTTVFRADLNKDVIFVLTTEGINNIIYN